MQAYNKYSTWAKISNMLVMEYPLEPSYNGALVPSKTAKPGVFK